MRTIDAICEAHHHLTDRLNEVRAEKRVSSRAVGEKRASAKAATKVAAQATKTKDLLMRVAELKRTEVSAKIERVTTNAIRAVLGTHEYEFKFRWEEKRGTLYAEPVLIQTVNGVEVETDILEGHGGGIADVVAFTLRFVIARMIPGLEKIIVCDEPFRHVSAGHAEGIASMLEILARKTGWRFLFTTHSEKLTASADRVYRAEKGEDGIVTVTEEGLSR